MKKYSSCTFIATVLVGLFSLGITAGAEIIGTGCYNQNDIIQGTPPINTKARCDALGPSVRWVVVQGSPTAEQQAAYDRCVIEARKQPDTAGTAEQLCTGVLTAAPGTTAPGGSATANDGVSWWKVLNPLTWLVSALGAVAIAILKLAELITGLAGLILNYVVQYSVVDMKENLDKASVVNNAWKVIRDISNMGFIFVLLYAAIMTIIGQGQDNQKLIVRIVVVAILINFSLFFTKVVIDISNVLAVTFYDAIAPGALNSGATLGLSNSLMEPLKLQSISKIDTGIVGERLLIIGVMGTIVSLIAAFVFFAIAIMFIIRFVVLIFVLVLSPIAFVSFVLPKMDKYRDQWWDALSGQAFFAPIYFMLTWIVIVISRGLLTSTGGSMATALTGAVNETGQIVPPDPSSLGILVNFIIMIALLIASLTIAKEWANKAGPAVGKLTSWATGAAGGATLGVAGRFGRGTIGRAGNAIAESEWLKSKAPTSMTARLALATSRKTAGASFDVRGSALGGNLDAGKAQKGGFAKDLKDKVDTEKKYADSLKPSDLVLAAAERNFDNIKKTGTVGQVAAAQAELDKLKGASEEDLRNRKIKEFRALGDSKKDARRKLDALEDARLRRINQLRASGMTEEAAKTKAKEEGIGWEAEKIKGVGVERKEAYAKDKETSATFAIPVPKTGKVIPFSISGRLGFVGPVKRERLEEANTIRKSIKEKKPAEKIAEEIKTQTETAAADSAGPEPTTPTTPTTSGPTPTS